MSQKFSFSQSSLIALQEVYKDSVCKRSRNKSLQLRNRCKKRMEKPGVIMTKKNLSLLSVRHWFYRLKEWLNKKRTLGESVAVTCKGFLIVLALRSGALLAILRREWGL
jgi:hypothetical protein